MASKQCVVQCDEDVMTCHFLIKDNLDYEYKPSFCCSIAILLDLMKCSANQSTQHFNYFLFSSMAWSPIWKTLIIFYVSCANISILYGKRYFPHPKKHSHSWMTQILIKKNGKAKERMRKVGQKVREMREKVGIVREIWKKIW